MKKKNELLCKIECPSCYKTIEIYQHKEVITPAQKAEIQLTYTPILSKQSTLS